MAEAGEGGARRESWPRTRTRYGAAPDGHCEGGGMVARRGRSAEPEPPTGLELGGNLLDYDSLELAPANQPGQRGRLQPQPPWSSQELIAADGGAHPGGRRLAARRTPVQRHGGRAPSARPPGPCRRASPRPTSTTAMTWRRGSTCPRTARGTRCPCSPRPWGSPPSTSACPPWSRRCSAP